MAERAMHDHTYHGLTRSLCSRCKAQIDARILFREGAVWLHKHCPEHGAQQVQIASSTAWYTDALSFASRSTPPPRSHPIHKDCPRDCGPCQQHQQQVKLPVIPLTSACNLSCPICYTINRSVDPWQLPAEDLRTLLQSLLDDDPTLDVINFTGGEPTLHPQLPELVAICREMGIERVTISTNGLRLQDEATVEALAKQDARIVLSLDTLDPEVDKKLLGANTVRAKLRALELLEKHDVATTLLPAVATGLNDSDVPALLDMVLERPHLRSLELHTLCFTGQGGAGYDRSARISTPDLHAIIEQHTAGAIRPDDFVPSPLAHPLCYSICYLLCLDDGGYVPFTRFLGRRGLYDLLADDLYIEPRAKLEEVLLEVIDDLWSDPDRLERSESVLSTLRGLIQRVYPADRPNLSLHERQHIAERTVRAIYIHSHMDEETFDVSRVMRCPVAVPELDGSRVPTCSYNVLHRGTDPRFTRRRTDEEAP